MTEFNEMTVDEDVSELPEDELRSTFAAFLETHESNVEAVDELRSQYAETVEGLEAEKEDLEDKVEEFTSEKASEAAEYVNIPEDLIVDRFSLEEIETIIEEGEEFAESQESDEESEDEEHLTTFAEREEKGKQGKETGRPSKYNDGARKLLGQKMGLDLTEDN